jgi:hypothetical protein
MRVESRRARERQNLFPGLFFVFFHFHPDVNLEQRKRERPKRLIVNDVGIRWRGEVWENTRDVQVGLIIKSTVNTLPFLLSLPLISSSER